jgi:hypothetical protein
VRAIQEDHAVPNVRPGLVELRECALAGESECGNDPDRIYFFRGCETHRAEPCPQRCTGSQLFTALLTQEFGIAQSFGMPADVCIDETHSHSDRSGNSTTSDFVYANDVASAGVVQLRFVSEGGFGNGHD